MITETASARWSAAEALAWAESTGFLLGCNYISRQAANQLEMWQAETWAPALIAEELAWAAECGMNSLRVFLHDLAYQQDPAGFLARMDEFLRLAHARGLGVLFVFFDSCWHPFPRAGAQRSPEPFVHNSCWLQSPGRPVLEAGTIGRLEPYVRAVLTAFRSDPRVLAWDLWNEPSNDNFSCYGPRDLEGKKPALVLAALRQVVRWCHDVRPDQPLTIGLWQKDLKGETPADLVELQLAASDIMSFHSYLAPEPFQGQLEQMLAHGRPVLCTEYMARPQGSTIPAILPLLRKQATGAFHWGLANGRTQTIFPWASWHQALTKEPDPWFHDLLHPDGRPYHPEEIACLRTHAP